MIRRASGGTTYFFLISQKQFPTEFSSEISDGISFRRKFPTDFSDAEKLLSRENSVRNFVGKVFPTEIPSEEDNFPTKGFPTTISDGIPSVTLFSTENREFPKDFFRRKSTLF